MISKAFPWIALGVAGLLAAPALSQTASQAAPAQTAPAPPPIPMVDRQAALDSLVAAEKAFARTAAEKGTRDAFLAFLADDGLMFQPDPVNGKELWRSRPAPPGLLSWYPVYSEVSLAGDLGFNTGPYEFRDKPGDKPVVFGHFATIWKRQADGSWKAALDLGATHPEPPAPEAPAISLSGPARVEAAAIPKVDFGVALAALLDADRAFATATQEKGSPMAYETVMTGDVRLMRASRQPVLGKAAARAFLAENPMPTTWEPLGGGIATSGDLGYTYGFVKRHEDGPESPWINTSNYLRVWRKEKEGPWKLAFEVFSPRPNKPKP
ncbi:MAG: YybH family protein [Thermoanaerobaculia bacterium]